MTDLNHCDPDSSLLDLSPAARLCGAIARRDGKAVRELLDAGFDPNASWQGIAPLRAAVSGGHAEIARLLLERGADPSATGAPGLTNLMVAAGHGRQDIVDLLLPLCDPKAVEPEGGKTALMRAAASVCAGEGVVRALAARSDADAQDKDGNTALHLAVERDFRAGALVLAGLSDLCVQNAQGQTALALALWKDDSNVFSILFGLAPPAALALPDNEGFTPMMRAVERNHWRGFFLLLSSLPEESLSQKNAAGLTAFDIAADLAQERLGSPAEWRRVELLAFAASEESIRRASRASWPIEHCPSLTARIEALALGDALAEAQKPGQAPQAGNSATAGSQAMARRL